MSRRFSADHFARRAGIFLLISTIQTQAGNNQQVPVPVCMRMIEEPRLCIDLRTQTITVGKDVSNFADLPEFCITVPFSTQINKPKKIILCLDASNSMCADDPNCPGAMDNDPANKRIDAANAFVDKMAMRCPQCQIGVVQYSDAANPSATVTGASAPLPLAAAANVAALHNAINAAACDGHGVLSHKRGARGLAKKNATYSGTALDTAIHLADLHYDTAYDRHVIIMTDGDWQTPIPDDMYTEYVANNPGRPFPIVHGVILCDSAGHVAAGFTPAGLADCSSGARTPVDLSFLKAATRLSTRNEAPNNQAGLYFAGTSPQTIARSFDTLFNIVVVCPCSGLQSVAFTDMTVSPPETKVAQIFSVSSTKYTVRAPDFSLQFGANTFIAAIETKDTSNIPNTIYDTIIIIRNSNSSVSDTVVLCGFDTLPISFTCKPHAPTISAFDTVIAAVQPQDSVRFTPNGILVRAFIPFPDNDTNTLALFHLDNNLVNSVQNGVPGAGTVSYSTANAAFNGAMISGSFTASLPAPIGQNDDLLIECWIKPGPVSQAVPIINCVGFSFGLTDDSYLAASFGGTRIKTDHFIDKSVWQHVAVARSGGTANIYINGLPMAKSASAVAVITAALTISALPGGALDEVRVSGIVPMLQLLGKPVLQIPLADQVTWSINNVQTTGQTAVISPSLWQGTPKGQVRFLCANAGTGPMIINFFDTSSSPLPYMWSKNADPEYAGAIRPPGSAATLVKAQKLSLSRTFFDARGRLLSNYDMRVFAREALPYKGVYFVKYGDGRVVRRVSLYK